MKRLYKRTATGAVQVWWQEADGNKYRTHSGQLGGKIVVSEWTVCSGKNVGRSNETTPEEQARREVESNYEKKRKDGYVESPEAAKASKRFRPMLAKNFDDYADKIFDEYDKVWSQPKLDGIRCIADAHGLWSRAGNPIVAVPHIYRILEPIFRKMPDLVLDGELYNHEFKDDFNQIVSLVKKQKPTDQDLRNSEDFIQYHIYDSPAAEPFEDRMGRVHDVEWATLTGIVIAVTTQAAKDRPSLDEDYASYLERGYEGQIVRLPGPYEQKRSKLLLKRKEFLDSEFRVVAIEEGVGNRSGMAGYAVLQLDEERTFRANIKGDRAFLRRLLGERGKYIGKAATVEYFKPTPDGVPRFPRVKTFHETRRW